MRLTTLSLDNPIAVIVGGLLLALFGVLSLDRLPVQLAPSVERPVISISTSWRAASPKEVESEIIEAQENVLRGLPGALRMTSTASNGNGQLTLEFDVETNLDRALLEVMNRLNQVPRYPVDATEPRITTGGGSGFEAIAWFAVKPLPGNEADAGSYRTYIEEVIQTRLERVDGVASSGVFGGYVYQVQIVFDPYKAADLGVSLASMQAVLASNQDVSGGTEDVGRRRYTLRYAGKLDVEELGQLILKWQNDKPVYLRDVAEISLKGQDISGTLHQNGGPSVAVNVAAQPGVNVLEIMGKIDEVVADLNANELSHAGLDMTKVYDETRYIINSVDMVRNNLLLGILLAVSILWWFLRKLRATLAVALAIPLCLLAVFLGLSAFGRSLNIISLAGLAFATGMVLDAAIVVLENIVRLKETGEKSQVAAEHGTIQVWGALFASTLTTVAIFLPVVFLKDAAGQMFTDLAITITVAIIASLLVAVTVLPTAASRWLEGQKLVDKHAHWWQVTADFIARLTSTKKRRLSWIFSLISIPLVLIVLLKPPADYLPEGRMNFMFAGLLVPPGISAHTAEEEITNLIDERLRPYLEGEKQPRVLNYFVGIFGDRGFMGARTPHGDDIEPLINVIRSEVVKDIPDTWVFPRRAAIFRNQGGGRGIDVDLQGSNFEQLLQVGGFAMQAINEAIPGARINPTPGLELAEPELRLYPDDRSLADAQLTRQQLGNTFRAAGDGLFVGEYFDGERKLDMLLRAKNWEVPEEMMAMPVVTANGTYSLAELAQLERTAGPSQIRRIDRRRTLSLQVVPPADMSLEEAIERLRDQVEPKLRAALPEQSGIQYRGSAEELQKVLSSMSGSFALAVVILYLLISALFRSFRDSLMVVLALPMATVGGVLALNILNLFYFQPMDLLTMMGFIILMGLVVNNAILLVHQARFGERSGLPRKEAVQEAVRLRLRPILMSTMTSIFGMLPLLLVPGEGSELYRGLAGVIVGGMFTSTLFTLILLPSLLRMGEAEEINPGSLTT